MLIQISTTKTTISLSVLQISTWVHISIISLNLMKTIKPRNRRVSVTNLLNPDNEDDCAQILTDKEMLEQAFSKDHLEENLGNEMPTPPQP